MRKIGSLPEDTKNQIILLLSSEMVNSTKWKFALYSPDWRP